MTAITKILGIKSFKLISLLSNARGCSANLPILSNTQILS